nr:hypothetical protein StreXyl84_29790 [Streptomyces sp. Xyl84]
MLTWSPAAAQVTSHMVLDARQAAKSRECCLRVVAARASLINPRPSQLPSRPPSTHTPWSGRGPWRPGGARHCTNDLDARGRVCSALPGSTADGMGAPRARRYGPEGGNGVPSNPVSADPPPEAAF